MRQGEIACHDDVKARLLALGKRPVGASAERVSVRAIRLDQEHVTKLAPSFLHSPGFTLSMIPGLSKRAKRNRLDAHFNAIWLVFRPSVLLKENLKPNPLRYPT